MENCSPLECGHEDWADATYPRVGYLPMHWLDYDPVALAVLVIGIGIIELLALII